MGKKSSGKTYTSKGIHCQDKSLSKDVKRHRDPWVSAFGKLNAWLDGKPSYTTYYDAKAKRNIRVKTIDRWGNPKFVVQG